jgi:hypothetical protein
VNNGIHDFIDHSLYLQDQIQYLLLVLPSSLLFLNEKYTTGPAAKLDFTARNRVLDREVR